MELTGGVISLERPFWPDIGLCAVAFLVIAGLWVLWSLIPWKAPESEGVSAGSLPLPLPRIETMDQQIAIMREIGASPASIATAEAAKARIEGLWGYQGTTVDSARERRWAHPPGSRPGWARNSTPPTKGAA